MSTWTAALHQMLGIASRVRVRTALVAMAARVLPVRHVIVLPLAPIRVAQASTSKAVRQWLQGIAPPVQVRMRMDLDVPAAFLTPERVHGAIALSPKQHSVASRSTYLAAQTRLLEIA